MPLTFRTYFRYEASYIVNRKPAIEWVMERQAVTTDKDSGIVNDANLWATETMAIVRSSQRGEDTPDHHPSA